MNIKTIIFDFDGVILETVGIKDLAFKTLFGGYPHYLNEIMDYHLSNNATIRFDKFKYITENILKKKYSKEEKERLSKGFTRLTFEKIIDCPSVPGVFNFLEDYYLKMPLYIATVNPIEEFQRILDQRNLSKYFKKIYTTPWNKSDAIKDILKRESVRSHEILFIGDSLEDYHAARENDVVFIGRDSGKSFEETQIPVFKDFLGISEFLKNETTQCEKEQSV